MNVSNINLVTTANLSIFNNSLNNQPTDGNEEYPRKHLVIDGNKRLL